jgi:CelD/BcsL family acetyltransferase involved in cellulose biosynthesis
MLSVRPVLRVEVAHEWGALTDSGANSFLSGEEWDGLLRDATSNVVFMTWEWQGLWWENFGDCTGCKLHLIAVRDGEGALVGIAPIFVAREPMPPLQEYMRGVLRPEGAGGPLRLVRLVGGKDIADYLDVIAAPGQMEAVWAAVLDYLVGIQGEWDAIDFHSLPDWSPSREILPRLATERGLEARVFPEDVSPVAQLPHDWETYLMSLRKKDRHELRRKVRRLESKEDARWALVPTRDRAAMAEGMETFLKLHRMSGADKAEFMDERMSAFFRAMAGELAGTGWLDLAILRVGEEPVSAYLSFLYGDRLYLYNSGYNPRFAKVSAGMALLAYRIHKAILQGVRVFDFLRGDEPYKYDFGGKNTYVWRAVLAPVGWHE